MKYRCPYCKTVLADPPPVKCPKCGHTMIPPPSGTEQERREHARKIRMIVEETEAKKRALGIRAPALPHGPLFYCVIIVGLTLLGIASMKLARAPAPLRDAKFGYAIRSVDALAVALGRYHFHTGRYPSAEEGLAVLATRSSPYKGWNGPYINHFREDPWKHPYVYEPRTNGVPFLLCVGPDGQRGTADDIAPNPDSFLRPGQDTSWTNDWVPYAQRGIIVVPSKAK